jgi:hypothetical protein
VEAITLSSNESQALDYLLELAFSDQAVYLGAGDVEGYGPEWPQIAGERASLCRTLAELTERIGIPQHSARFTALATDYESTVAQ